MTADWTTCLVVRDRDGDLWVWGAIRARWMRLELYAEATADQLAEFGPLTPILDADGLPVVRTVGDLTARHVGKRVRIDGWFKGRLSNLGWVVDPSEIDLTAVDDGEFQYGLIPLDTPCEVLDA